MHVYTCIKDRAIDVRLYFIEDFNKVQVTCGKKSNFPQLPVKKTYISLDAVFDEDFTSPLSMPDLPYQGALKIRNTQMYTLDPDALNETT